MKSLWIIIIFGLFTILLLIIDGDGEGDMWGGKVGGWSGGGGIVSEDEITEGLEGEIDGFCSVSHFYLNIMQ